MISSIRTKNPKTVDGILNIDKPAGRTSYSIVAMVKRLSGEKRVGHAGTLDPEATGVLPVCLGRATRFVEFLTDAVKSYRAEIELGVVTDTYDSTGKVIERKDFSGVSRENLVTALGSFRGPIQQIPPMYSALKHKGKPLYELARAGIQVERKARSVEIYSLELIDWQPPLVTLEVVCSKGTYIRSLAHDLGQSLGCGAVMKSLTRLRCGVFDIKDAISMDRLEDAFRHGYWRHFVYPTDAVLLNWAAMIVGDSTSELIRNGTKIDYPASNPPPDNRCRAYTSEGRFLSVLYFDSVSKQWQPKKVLL